MTVTEVKIHLDIVPPTITAQQKGVRIVQPKHGKAFVSHYVKKEVEKTEKLFVTLLQGVKHRPLTPIPGPVSIETNWIFPYRESEPKRNFGKLIWHYKRPDYGNLQKLLDDCLVKAGYLEDDGQISDGRTTKHWGQFPGIWITIKPL